MKSTFISVFSLFVFTSGFAQFNEQNLRPELPIGYNLHLKSADKSKYLNTERDGKGISFGYVPFLSGDLNNYLDSNSSMNGTFNDNYMTLGFDNVSNNSKHLDVISNLGFILPQTVSAGNADSVQYRLGGWHYTMSLLGYDVVKGDVVTLAIGPAWSWGNLKMRRTVAGNKTRYTNPFVAPGARAEFRLTLGNFYLGGRATYRYDFTHELWKRKNDLMPVLPEYENSGLAYFGYLGLIF